MKITIDAIPDGNGSIVKAGIEVSDIVSIHDADAAIRYLQDIKEKLKLRGDEND